MFVERKIEENCLFSKILTLGHMFAAFQAGEYSHVQDCRPQLSWKSVACYVVSSANLFSNAHRMFRSAVEVLDRHELQHCNDSNSTILSFYFLLYFLSFLSSFVQMLNQLITVCAYMQVRSAAAHFSLLICSCCFVSNCLLASKQRGSVRWVRKALWEIL